MQRHLRGEWVRRIDNRVNLALLQVCLESGNPTKSADTERYGWRRQASRPTSERQYGVQVLPKRNVPGEHAGLRRAAEYKKPHHSSPQKTTL
jgi:hypothetical protein